MTTRLSILASAAFIIPLILFTPGCEQKASVQVDVTPKFTRAEHMVDAKTLTPEVYGKINDGMTQEDVRKVFGTTAPVVKSYKAEEEYELVWKADDKEIVVRFRGDKSIKKSEKGVAAK